MNSGTEAADQVVNMSLKSLEVLAKISGAGAKNLAVFLYTVLKSKNKSKGKARLESMLKSGKELKVFSIRSSDLKTFKKYAKKYGVLYCTVKDRKGIDQMCDIIVRAEDAAKINRIVERFQFADVTTNATIRTAKEDPQAEKTETSEQHVDQILDHIFGESADPVPQQTTEEKIPSETSSLEIKANTTKHSVREDLFEIKKVQEQRKEVEAKESDKQAKTSNAKKHAGKKNQNKTQKKKQQKKTKAR